jgi:hypothetical protein
MGADGGEPPESAPAPGTFPSQADAETFIGDSWRELLDADTMAAIDNALGDAVIRDPGLTAARAPQQRPV